MGKINGADDLVSIPRRTWKEAFKDKAILITWVPDGNSTVGYHICFYLWSADIWFGKLPLLKFILAVNVVVWILQFVF